MLKDQVILIASGAHAPSLDWFGSSSIGSALLAVALMLLACSWTPRAIRTCVLYASPFLLLVLALAVPEPRFGRHPGLEAFLTYYILISTGFGFGLVLFRRETVPAIALGCWSLLLFGTLAVIDIVLKLNGSLALHEGAPGEFDDQIWLALLLFWSCLALVTWRLSRNHYDRWMRGARGLCQACGYDLHGNPAANECPECGAPLHKQDAAL